VTRDDTELRPARPVIRESFRGPMVDGLPAGASPARWRRRVQRLLVSKGEHEEAELERLLGGQPSLSRANVVAVISPKPGVGKTSSAFAIGGLLADRLRLRVIAVDANPDIGTLVALAPSRLRCQRSLADLLTDIEQIETAAQLRSYVSALPSGLHLLGAPADAEVMARLGPDAYGELIALLCTFYDVVLLDLGTGVAGPVLQSAIGRADQVVLVTTPESVASTAVFTALRHLQQERTIVVANKFHARRAADLRELERRLRERRMPRPIAIPYDDQLAAMLDTATYHLDALERTRRIATKRLAVAVAEQLV
jgi:MinD-like ATPase involved in chromosome partitioning or flagellar assembly